MTILLIALLLLCDIIMYIVFFDVILSWLSLTGIKFRPQIIKDLLDPLYEKIEDTIPVNFGPFSFTPFIIIIIIYFIKGSIGIFFPQIGPVYNNLLNLI